MYACGTDALDSAFGQQFALNVVQNAHLMTPTQIEQWNTFVATMTPEQIEKLWNKVGVEALQMSIVTYFKEKYLAGEEGYRDRARIDCLNRLTNGGFDAEAQAVGGRRVKLLPIDLVTATED